MKISIDNLVWVLSSLYPKLKGGEDYGVQQTLNDKGQSNLDAKITHWPSGIAQPTKTEIMAELNKLSKAATSNTPTP